MAQACCIYTYITYALYYPRVHGIIHGVCPSEGNDHVRLIEVLDLKLSSVHVLEEVIMYQKVPSLSNISSSSECMWPSG